MFCCHCDEEYRWDVEKKECRIFVCRVAAGGDACVPSKLARSELVVDYTNADQAMIHEASGGLDHMTLEHFLTHTASLGDTDPEALTAKFSEHDVNNDGIITVDEMRLK
ncbi:uncharacterized protein RCC_01902 [Ramularia collo-cygni]|uniref:EF-hand domain-containing protein n=1 Tax=Ramularia collo-cygni TaxID=112498 RepID=A0A2D3UM52_9PEZI|nr:uncharacterized protein RCC_01902 [Ramularia collo-cygni]CZT16062.1 uncharacterized protein RCC_01902 [Ramularia collo-cygni]